MLSYAYAEKNFVHVGFHIVGAGGSGSLSLSLSVCTLVEHALIRQEKVKQSLPSACSKQNVSLFFIISLACVQWLSEWQGGKIESQSEPKLFSAYNMTAQHYPVPVLID